VTEGTRVLTRGEKIDKLLVVRRRFESGHWDDLDVRLLHRLALVAVVSLNHDLDHDFTVHDTFRRQREDNLKEVKVAR
jgi:hypothetical protein